MLLAGLLAPAAAFAAEPAQATQVWFTPGFLSHHFERDVDLREDNWGLGGELQWSNEWGLVGGSFANSERQRSRYLAVQWLPWHTKFLGADVGLGLVAGVIDGYPRMRDGGAFPVALPMLAVEWDRVGMNLSVVPTIHDRLHGAVVAQFKLRVW